MKSDSAHTTRCFDRISDELFKMVVDEEDSALRQGMDTTLDHTINWHRMRVLGAVAAMLQEVGVECLTDFDKDGWMCKVGLYDEQGGR